jgi:hypothetical protein
MLVGAALSFWHQHPVLAQRCALNFSLPDRSLILDVTTPGLCRRPASAWNLEYLKRISQSIANQLDSVATLDTATWCRPFTIELHVPTVYGRC